MPETTSETLLKKKTISLDIAFTTVLRNRILEIFDETRVKSRDKSLDLTQF